MRNWQVLTVNRVSANRYRILYLLDGKERQYALVNSLYGLDRAIAETGKMLALLPRYRKPRIGDGPYNAA